jgi:hypothetical protein
VRMAFRWVRGGVPRCVQACIFILASLIKSGCTLPGLSYMNTQRYLSITARACSGRPGSPTGSLDIETGYRPLIPPEPLSYRLIPPLTLG